MADTVLWAVSQCIEKGGIIHSLQWGNSYRGGNIACFSVGFPVAAVDWRGFTAFRKGRREKTTAKAVDLVVSGQSDANKRQELGGKMLSEKRRKQREKSLEGFILKG